MGFIIGGQSTSPATVYSATSISTLQPSAKSAVTDSSGNVYFAGYSYLGRGYPSACVVKVNSSGTLQWTKELNNAPWDTYPMGIALDSGNNVYVTGYTEVQDGASRKTGGFLAKLDTNGNSQFTKYVADQGYGYTRLYSIKIDSSDNIFVAGPSDDQDSNYANTKSIIVKYNTSGTVQWTKAIGTGTGGKLSMNFMTMDSSGNFYLTGYTNPDYPSKYTWVTYKLDSSANIVWSREHSSGSYYAYGNNVAVDSAGNVYNAGSFSGDTYLVKFNSSGSVLWQRQLASTNAVDDTPSGGIAFDSSNNVYLYGRTSDTSPSSSYDMFIVKYNSSGVLQWQRKFVSSPDADYASGITIDSDNNICLTGSINGSNTVYLKLPSDGSMTGTYTINGASATYSASSLTDSASSISFGGISSSIADRTKNTGTLALTVSSTSLTPVATTLATIAGTVIPSGMTLGGTGTGMIISSYVPPPNWLNLMTGLNTNSAYNYNVASNGTDMYVIGTYHFMSPSNNPGRGISIYKYNSAGALQWSKRQYQNHYYYDAWDAEVDSSGNLYVAGCLFNGHGGYSTISTLKYDSAGNLLWRSALHSPDGNYSQSGGSSGGSGLFGKDLVLDSSENVYTVGPNYTNSSSQIVKYNSSGTLQWQKRISFSTATTITRDSSNNLYIGSEYAGYFVKCDSSGTVIYSRTVAYGGQNLYINSMNVDSSDNVYIHGRIYDTVTSMNKQIVMKYDSSGTVLWQRKIGHAWVGVKGYTNAAGDTYMVGTSNNATSTAGVKSATVVKYNSAGTLQFQRYIKSNVTNATITPTAIKEYGSEKMVITASTDATSAGGYTKQLTIVLPNNGSATGTYTAAGYSWTYATCTDAEAASTITSGVGTATTSTTSHAVPPIWDSLEGNLTVTSTTTTLS